MFNVKRVSRAFLFSSEIVSSSIAYICPGTLYCQVLYSLTGMVIVESYLVQHFVVTGPVN